ncbi:hypothetical protein CDD81_1750 [Ophiocordyceps australis]|uniref:3-beta hydroxysteroid dehydrogenase/isomerase domain-containing protein n=1 Tax=Ophiocordyceps australis TaxID=1399860 RepID=A0A2C5YFB2_9HYPO|nr:hypothetical protein CDD81_1750 [Ophiocordyceps australis]
MDSESSVSLSPVLITGGCGFIGFHLTQALLASDPNCQIHVLDIKTDSNRVHGVTYHTGDVSSLPQVKAAFAAAAPKTVFHMACPQATSQQPEAVYREACVTGTHNTLRAAGDAAVQAFVFTATSSLIHDHESDMYDADESWPILRYPEQKCAYSLAKVEAEDEARGANRRHGDMLTASIWPAAVFGPRDNALTGNVVKSARAGRGNIQIGPGTNLYNVTYVSNAADAHILAAQALVRAYGKPPLPPGERVEGEAFIITNDEIVNFWDFHRAIGASAGYPVKPQDIKVVPIWLAMLIAGISEWITWILTLGRRKPAYSRWALRLTTINRTLKCDKAKRLLGYKPRVSIDEGLAISGQWYRNQGVHVHKTD